MCLKGFLGKTIEKCGHQAILDYQCLPSKVRSMGPLHGPRGLLGDSRHPKGYI